jgi:hypothetical protein
VQRLEWKFIGSQKLILNFWTSVKTRHGASLHSELLNFWTSELLISTFAR